MNKLIDHTLLKATATTADIEKLCAEAAAYSFKSVCVNPCYVALAKERLDGSGVLVCSVVGFPLGADTIEDKRAQTRAAVAAGAGEIDMVINIGKALERDYDYLEEEIKAVVEAAEGRVVKVIIETCYLTDDIKRELARLAARAGAGFLKTSTGFGTGGATEADVRLLREELPESVGVKASGGIKTKEDALRMISAGANRIGTSSGVTLVKEE